MRCHYCAGQVGNTYRSFAWWVNGDHLQVTYACYKKRCRLALRRFAYKNREAKP